MSNTTTAADITTANPFGENEMATFVYGIASVCHEVNRAYCESMGVFTIQPWEQASPDIVKNAMQGVLFRMTNPLSTPKDMHANWVKDKVRAGWVYGEVKDAERMTHPCIVPYDQLPQAQRTKDNLFMAVVDSTRKLMGV